MTTGAVFALLALVHVWRVIAEGTSVVNLWFLLITAAAAALSLWAVRLLTRPQQPNV